MEKEFFIKITFNEENHTPDFIDDVPYAVESALIHLLDPHGEDEDFEVLCVES